MHKLHRASTGLPHSVLCDLSICPRIRYDAQQVHLGSDTTPRRMNADTHAQVLFRHCNKLLSTQALSIPYHCPIQATSTPLKAINLDATTDAVTACGNPSAHLPAVWAPTEHSNMPSNVLREGMNGGRDTWRDNCGGDKGSFRALRAASPES